MRIRVSLALLAGLGGLAWVAAATAKPTQEIAQLPPGPTPAIAKPRVAQWEYRQLVRCLSLETLGREPGERQIPVFPGLDGEGRHGWELVSMMALQDPRQAVQDEPEPDPRLTRLLREPRQCLLAVLKRQTTY